MSANKLTAQPMGPDEQAIVNLIKALIPDKEQGEKLIQDLYDTLAKHFTRPQDFTPTPLTDKQREAAREVQSILSAVDNDTRKAIFTVVAVIAFGICYRIEPLKSYYEIDRYLRLLLGDAYFSKLPNTVDEELKARGVDKGLANMSSFEELCENLSKPFVKGNDWVDPTMPTPWFDTVLPTLDMIFEPRYGWPLGTAAKMTIPDLCLALENAIEQDNPSKPSIWRITG